MEVSEFWDIVEAADAQSGGDMNQKCEALKTAVGRLSREEAIDFSHKFDTAMDRAYTWSLWGAAYVINGGCSDDSFMDFRASLISRGRVAFDSALSNPESLADEKFDEEAWFFEGFQYAVTDGVGISAGSIPDRLTSHPDSPTGQEWSEDDVYDLFPRLSQKFG